MFSSTVAVLCVSSFVLIVSLIAVVIKALVGTSVVCNVSELMVCTPKLVLVDGVPVIGTEELVAISAPIAVVLSVLPGGVFVLDI